MNISKVNRFTVGRRSGILLLCLGILIVFGSSISGLQKELKTVDLADLPGSTITHRIKG